MNSHPKSDTWTAIIQAYGLHGEAKEALKLFQQMLQQNIKPTAITFICILSACSHAGLHNWAWHLYSSMQPSFGIVPDSRHQACIVDVWGRAGMLDKAEQFINGLERKEAILWRTLLAACYNSGDVERAKRAANLALELEPRDAATHVLIANAHGAAGQVHEQAEVWHKMKNEKIKKIPGATWVSVNGQTQIFYVDSDHPYSKSPLLLSLFSSLLFSLLSLCLIDNYKTQTRYFGIFGQDKT